MSGSDALFLCGNLPKVMAMADESPSFPFNYTVFPPWMIKLSLDYYCIALLHILMPPFSFSFTSSDTYPLSVYLSAVICSHLHPFSLLSCMHSHSSFLYCTVYPTIVMVPSHLHILKTLFYIQTFPFLFSHYL